MSISEQQKHGWCKSNFLIVAALLIFIRTARPADDIPTRSDRQFPTTPFVIDVTKPPYSVFAFFAEVCFDGDPFAVRIKETRGGEIKTVGNNEGKTLPYSGYLGTPK